MFSGGPVPTVEKLGGPRPPDPPGSYSLGVAPVLAFSPFSEEGIHSVDLFQGSRKQGGQGDLAPQLLIRGARSLRTWPLDFSFNHNNLIKLTNLMTFTHKPNFIYTVTKIIVPYQKLSYHI